MFFIFLPIFKFPFFLCTSAPLKAKQFIWSNLLVRKTNVNLWKKVAIKKAYNFLVVRKWFKGLFIERSKVWRRCEACIHSSYLALLMMERALRQASDSSAHKKIGHWNYKRVKNTVISWMADFTLHSSDKRGVAWIWDGILNTTPTSRCMFAWACMRPTSMM